MKIKMKELEQMLVIARDKGFREGERSVKTMSVESACLNMNLIEREKYEDLKDINEDLRERIERMEQIMNSDNPKGHSMQWK